MPLPTALVYACQRICGIGFGLAIYGHKKQARGQQQHQASIQTMAHSMRRHKVEARVYEVRRRRDRRGFDLISDRLPFGGLRYFTALRGLMSLLVYALPLPLCCYKLGMARPASVAACAIELSADRFNHRKYAGAMNLGAILRRENSRTP
jgi:hypothetical protein